MKTRNNIIRQPRPLGLTVLTKSISNKDTIIDENITGKLISYMLNNNIHYNGKKLTIESLATYLNKPTHLIMKLYIQYTNKLSQTMLGNRDKLLGALIFSSICQIQEDKASCRAQAEILAHSQGGQFKPFVSNALNDILATNISATKQYMELAKLLNPSSNSIQLNQQFNSNDEISGIKSIGTQEALNLLESQGITKLAYNEERYKELKAQHGIDNMPIVNAKLQGQAKEIPILNNPNSSNEPLKEDNKQHHRTRRSRELGLDEENHL